MIPSFKNYIWGGDRLAKEFGKKTDGCTVAESWEVSCHPDGPSFVGSGEFEGMALREVLDARPEWISPGCADASGFPILIKLIDAKQNLSLQVHPDDAYARAHENDNGKNEAWYIIDCEPGAGLILGLREHTSPIDIPAMINDGVILDYVNTVPVKPGDSFLIPAGLLHAVCGGALIAEVQQSSNITYRVYDYGRLETDGKPRALHIDKAAAVIDETLRSYNGADFAVTRRCDGFWIADLADWRFFKTSKLSIDGEASLVCDSSFHALLVIEGAFSVAAPGPQPISVIKGASVFIPAGLGKYMIKGRGQILLTTI